MAFLKLDTGILNSTLWVDRECREVFITALLMAQPFEVREPMPQIEVRTLKETGFVVPVGWYGFIEAAGVGIVRVAMTDPEQGMQALERLGSPDIESRSQAFEGRRLVRVNGGYIALNFMEYRDRDHTAAERSKRYRDRQKAKEAATRDGVGATRDDTYRGRNVTQAEAEADAEADADAEAQSEAEIDSSSSTAAVEQLLTSLPTDAVRSSWRAEMNAALQGAHGAPLSAAQIEIACRDYIGNGHTAEKPSLRHFRAFLRSAGKPIRNSKGRISEGRNNLTEWMEKP